MSITYLKSSCCRLWAIHVQPICLTLDSVHSWDHGLLLTVVVHVPQLVLFHLVEFGILSLVSIMGCHNHYL